VAQASDLASTTRLAKAALDQCYEARDYAQLNATTTLLSKKHGQLKGVVQAIVEKAITWLPEIRQREGDAKWLELVETLRAVTEGKACRGYIRFIFAS
jgi:26S proteasome regulatory subunit N5